MRDVELYRYLLGLDPPWAELLEVLVQPLRPEGKPAAALFHSRPPAAWGSDRRRILRSCAVAEAA